MLNQTTGQILEILLSGTHVSGEDIAVRMGLSRTAVWKSIEILRDIGYEIDSFPGKGYSILSAPDIPLPQEVKRHLKVSFLSWQIEYLPECTSTNTLLKERAVQGAPEGLVLVADHQTAGRGRRGRTWADTPGSALLFSVLLRPALPPPSLMPLTLVMGVAVAEALQPLGVSCTLKWPNDLLLGGAKMCGILTEISGEVDHTDFAVVGVGINVQARSDLEQYTATALNQHIVPPPRAQLLAAVLDEMAASYREFLVEGSAKLLEKWSAMSATLRRPVVAHTASGDVFGTAVGVDSSGALLLRTEDGKSLVISTGEVSLRHL